MNIKETFLKFAAEKGISAEQANSFLAEQSKTAQEELAILVQDVVKSAGIEVNPYAEACVQGCLKVALDNNKTVEQAKEMAKQAILKVKQTTKTAGESKESDNMNINTQEKFAAYAQGFLKRAQDYGCTEGQGIDLLNQLLAKKADAGGAGGPPPPQDPSAGGGAPPMDPGALMAASQGGGGEPTGGPAPGASMDPAQLQQLMAVLQQLLQGQQGQPQGQQPVSAMNKQM